MSNLQIIEGLEKVIESADLGALTIINIQLACLSLITVLSIFLVFFALHMFFEYLGINTTTAVIKSATNKRKVYEYVYKVHNKEYTSKFKHSSKIPVNVGDSVKIYYLSKKPHIIQFDNVTAYKIELISGLAGLVFGFIMSLVLCFIMTFLPNIYMRMKR